MSSKTLEITNLANIPHCSLLSLDLPTISQFFPSAEIFILMREKMGLELNIVAAQTTFFCCSTPSTKLNDCFPNCKTSFNLVIDLHWLKSIVKVCLYSD